MNARLSEACRRLHACLSCTTVLFLAATAWIGASLVVADGAHAQNDDRYRRLTPTEITAASQAALSRIAPSGVFDDLEILLVERHEPDKRASRAQRRQRQADVFVYDYRLDQLIALQVDSSGEATVVHQSAFEQLPLSSSEQGRVQDLAFSDPQVVAAIEASYLSATGRALRSREQLNLRAWVFYAESMPLELNADSMLCGLHRCALLLMYTKQDLAIDVLPLVDLSNKRVLQLLSFGAHSHAH